MKIEIEEKKITWYRLKAASIVIYFTYRVYVECWGRRGRWKSIKIMYSNRRKLGNTKTVYIYMCIYMYVYINSYTFICLHYT